MEIKAYQQSLVEIIVVENESIAKQAMQKGALPKNIDVKKTKKMLQGSLVATGNGCESMKTPEEKIACLTEQSFR